MLQDPFLRSSLLIVYEGANPAIRRRLISRESSMGTSEATARTEEEEDIQGARRRTSCLNMNDIVVYMLLHKSAVRNPLQPVSPTFRTGDAQRC